MLKKLLSIAVLILFACLLVVLFYYFNILKSKTVHIAFVGDQGLTENSEKVLSLINKEGVDLTVFLGDFDYLDRPDLWLAQTTAYLSPDAEYIGVVGNHDERQWLEYQSILLRQQVKNTATGCSGEVGVKQSCVIGDVHIVGIAPGIFDRAYVEFLEQSFSENNSRWNICVWHKNQHDMQTGEKTDEVGWDVYEVCRKYGALIITGHEHAYSRTHLLSSVIDKTINDTDDNYDLVPGKAVVVVSGLGGHSVREQKTSGDWWANVYTKDNGAMPGAFFCEFGVGESDASCYFKNIDGVIIDEFSL